MDTGHLLQIQLDLLVFLGIFNGASLLTSDESLTSKKTTSSLSILAIASWIEIFGTTAFASFKKSE